MLKKSFSFWQNVLFTDEARVRISDGIVRFFRRNATRFLEKKITNSFDFGQTITYVLACNTIRWTKLLVKRPNKLNAVG